MSHAEVFAGIYERNDWHCGSGPGSLPQLAAPYIRFVERYLRRHEIGRVLDLGCGDGQLARAIDWGCASYTGIDVVAGLGGVDNINTSVIDGDIRTCPWPDADLVLIKDVLQHWPNYDVEALRPRLARYSCALITNSVSGPVNEDIPVGGIRALDLAAPPFRWPVREVLRWWGDEPKSTVRLTGALPVQSESPRSASGRAAKAGIALLPA